MSTRKAISRRATVGAMMSLPLLGATIALARAQSRTGSGMLVAYYTRTANTELIARQIETATQATLFRIETAEPYPEEYEAQVAQATRERESGFEPRLRASVQSFASYGTVFLGMPVWGMSAPSPLRSFLSSHDMTGKTLVPFITHGGYGVGDCEAVIADHAPAARILESFVKECDQERETLRLVTGWLSQIDRG